MDRSAVKALRKRGKSLREIAAIMGCDKDTVQRVLASPSAKRYERNSTGSSVDRYRDSIIDWIKGEVTVQRMLELAREDKENPYEGSRSVFYRRVAQLREAHDLAEKEKFVRFEGLPGEYVQVDWGEVRAFPFQRQAPGTVYFFAARLKWSRFSYVLFVRDTRLETLVRCLLRAFESFGGVPWIAVFDNMKTVVVKRDVNGQPVWNPKFLRFTSEIDFHPEACWPASGNQKGSVENLVGWVKDNFLKGRSFLDEADLAEQCRGWLDRSNGSLSQAHGLVPREVLPKEQARFTSLAETAENYGLASFIKAGHDMLAHVDGNRYMIPECYVGRSLLARIRRFRIDFYDAEKLVATYDRRLRREFRPIQDPNYCEGVLRKKPRARVMMYRDHLMEQDGSVAAFITELCRRRRGTDSFGPHILEIYQLWRKHGTDELGVACAIASEHGAYAADYLIGLLRPPKQVSRGESLVLEGVPGQTAVDRDLAEYETYATGGAPSWTTTT